jgi:uncharacterized phage protein (TIGR02218 family)
VSKTVTVALKNELALGSTTMAWCWKATRRDGFILAVTTCSRDFIFEGVLYQPRYGFNPKAIASDASGAVQNTEVDGFLSSVITEEDIEAGVWDGCEVETFQVNYRDFSMGKISFGIKTMGDLKAGRTAFNGELRGLTQSIQKQIGRIVTAGCPWKFGDPDTCRFDVAPFTVTGTLTSVTNRRTFADTSRSEADDYFAAGVLTMTSGEAEGEALEVYSFASDVFITHLPFSHNIAVGDTYSVTPGCRKRYTEDCLTKFSNTNNFGGFPLLPGSDKVLGLGGGA